MFTTEMLLFLNISDTYSVENKTEERPQPEKKQNVIKITSTQKKQNNQFSTMMEHLGHMYFGTVQYLRRKDTLCRFFISVMQNAEDERQRCFSTF